MKGFVCFVAFVSLAGFYTTIDAAVYRTILLELQENPVSIASDADIDSTMSQDIPSVPQEVRNSAMQQLYSVTSRRLSSSQLNQHTGSGKYSITLAGQPTRPKNLYLIPLGSPAQLWFAHKGVDQCTDTSIWYAFWV